MSGRNSIFLSLATIFTLSFSLVDGASLRKSPVAPFIYLDENFSNASLPEEFPAASVTTTATSSNCTPRSTCFLFFQDVTVYYWPEGSQNTTCLSDPPTQPVIPSIPNIQSPSVYAIFESIRASNGCNTVGKTFAGFTTSFAPGALSTIGPDFRTSSFNFGDLPCPPPDKGWDPSKGRYQPQLAPPEFLFTLDPAFATCTPGFKQGIDPYHTLSPANQASGPEPVGCVHGHKVCTLGERALERPHLVPWAPQKTAEPTY